MQSLRLSPGQLRCAVGAMCAVAEATPPLGAGERAWITTLARLLGGTPGSFEVVPASEVAQQITSPDERERVLQWMMLVALADEQISVAEADVVARYAAALGVDEPRVHSLRLLAEGHVLRAWFGLARQGSARLDVEHVLRREGLGGVWRIVAPLVGLALDPDLTRRYNDLGKLPAGTLGRAYWEFILRHQLAFPGEARSVAESGLWHDLSHVLGGYGTDPEGEVQVVSFIAGYRREDPFFWLFTIALQFHLGLRVSPYSPGLHGHFQPDLVARALERGMAMNTDLSRDWDPWPHMREPLDAVRASLGVPP